MTKEEIKNKIPVQWHTHNGIRTMCFVHGLHVATISYSETLNNWWVYIKNIGENIVECNTKDEARDVVLGCCAVFFLEVFIEIYKP